MNAITMLELSDGSVALVDGEDLTRVAGYEWTLPSSSSVRYPVSRHCQQSDRCEPIFLHRLIANAGPEDIVIHRNHDTLDNRRENLVVLARHAAVGYVGCEVEDSLLAD